MGKSGHTICSHGDEPFTCPVCNLQPPARPEEKFPLRVWIAEDGTYFDTGETKWGALDISNGREPSTGGAVYVPLARAELAEKRLAKAKADGIRECIKRLRELQDEYNHQRKWNSSGVTTFAPVELSDWLLVNVLAATAPDGREEGKEDG